MKSLKPYTDSFAMVGGKGMQVTLARHARKVMWLLKKDDIYALDKNLEGHLRTLDMYSAALTQ